MDAIEEDEEEDEDVEDEEEDGPAIVIAAGPVLSLLFRGCCGGRSKGRAFCKMSWAS